MRVYIQHGDNREDQLIALRTQALCAVGTGLKVTIGTKPKSKGHVVKVTGDKVTTSIDSKTVGIVVRQSAKPKERKLARCEWELANSVGNLAAAMVDLRERGQRYHDAASKTGKAGKLGRGKYKHAVD